MRDAPPARMPVITLSRIAARRFILSRQASGRGADGEASAALNARCAHGVSPARYTPDRRSQPRPRFTEPRYRLHAGNVGAALLRRAEVFRLGRMARRATDRGAAALARRNAPGTRRSPFRSPRFSRFLSAGFWTPPSRRDRGDALGG